MYSLFYSSKSPFFTDVLQENDEKAPQGEPCVIAVSMVVQGRGCRSFPAAYVCVHAFPLEVRPKLWLVWLHVELLHSELLLGSVWIVSHQKTVGDCDTGTLDYFNNQRHHLGVFLHVLAHIGVFPPLLVGVTSSPFLPKTLSFVFSGGLFCFFLSKSPHDSSVPSHFSPHLTFFSCSLSTSCAPLIQSQQILINRHRKNFLMLFSDTCSCMLDY